MVSLQLPSESEPTSTTYQASCAGVAVTKPTPIPVSQPCSEQLQGIQSPLFPAFCAAEPSPEAVLLAGTASGEFTPVPQQQAASASCCRKREKRGPAKGTALPALTSSLQSLQELLPKALLYLQGKKSQTVHTPFRRTGALA